jgi:hypothetical protein
LYRLKKIIRFHNSSLSISRISFGYKQLSAKIAAPGRLSMIENVL